ncbi:MAG: hypothetical protein J6386_01035 [Candidatus Synoicihabitans palmerolidicus]|nr:hypothetical protein [Candidatus Synoicihabitans palmerolidicus]
MIALDDGKAAFPVGHVRLLNLSGLAVRGALDDASFELPVLPRITAPQRIGSRVKVGVAFERQSRPVVGFDQSLSVNDGERLFLAPFREGADLRTRVVRDQVSMVGAGEGD